MTTDKTSTHLIKPGTLASDFRMRCGLSASTAGDNELLGTEDGIRSIDCIPCLHDLIADLRAEGQGLDSPEARWIVDGETGTSSITIWSVMTGRPMPRDRAPGVPRDPSDFGRCFELLELFPAWKTRLDEVSAAHPAWAGLVDAWAELSDLYRAELPSGHAPILYARMKACR